MKLDLRTSSVFMQHNLNQGSEGFLAIRLFFLKCKLHKESSTFKENFKDFVSGNADVSNQCVFCLSTLVVDGFASLAHEKQNPS